MAEIIKMPKLSDTMEEGVVAKWHKQIGDQVEEGELLADIETDKATMEFESFESGVLLHQGVKEGEASEVDSILAIVGEKGENIDDLLEGSSSASSSTEEKKEEASSSSSSASDIDTSDVNAKIIKMPKLSDTMEEGTVAAWVKQKGDKVESGEILAEIETDKATMEFESFEDGTLLYQGVSEGESAPVDAILAIVGEEGADFQKLIDSYSANGADDKKETSSKSAAKEEPKAQ
jgi:pyruvate dehydrogenase E2 component (dihydrolipoamide acetyltransferase)